MTIFYIGSWGVSVHYEHGFIIEYYVFRYACRCWILPPCRQAFSYNKESNMDLTKWKEKNSVLKKYAHFDKRVSVNSVWNYISNPEKVAHHGFYPFIHYTQHSDKYNKSNGIKTKNREICYSAHKDRCIFQYYSYMLNEKYNERVRKDGINNVAVAYRNNLGLTNIDFSKSAFDFIKKSESCYIMVGDFTSFFDNLNHEYLKKQLCSLLNTDRLPDDYYAVYKNVTKYSVWELTDILKLNGFSGKYPEKKKLDKQDTVLTLEDFKKYKKQYVKKNKGTKGIPQGSAISAVLANIYMLDADKKINDYVKSRNGFYMRYSDDFIIIIPSEKEDFEISHKWLTEYINNLPDMELSPEKTKLFRYQNNTITSCNNEFIPQSVDGKNILDFLGFEFDGREVRIRAKTITKYYYRMYRKAKNIVKSDFKSPKNNKISCENLYEKYSVKGAKVENGDYKKGNFITYVYHADRVYNKKEPITVPVKKHMIKIRHTLGK